MDINDDFERFCEIAQRSPRNSLSPSYQSPEPYMGRRLTQRGYMPDKDETQVRRSSSFREPRSYSSIQQKRRSGNISSTRSPVRIDHHLSLGSRGDSGAMSASQRSALSSHHHGLNNNFSEQGDEFSEGQQAQFMEENIQDENESPRFRPSPRMNATNRHRAGSMKEMGRKHPKTYYRPSAPAVYPDTLSPNYGIEQTHSPGRYSNNSNDNMVCVRRFQRKKDGQVISKGDRKIPQIELYPTERAQEMQRMSSAYPSYMSSGTNPTIYTHDVSDRSETSDSDNEVIEIPAITTTLVNQSLHHGSARAIQTSALHSPNALRADTRNRSRSWAYVYEPETVSPTKSRTSARTDVCPTSQPLTVQVLGSSRVGKTSLCMQFQTSESLDVTLECAQEDELTRNITVEVNNEKFHLVLIDTNLMNDDFQSSSDSDIIESADAYVVVYAIDDKSTFITARSIVNYLLGKCKRSSAILLAANKSDLVRTRAVSQEDGKNLAAIYSCRFYEISTSLNHRVDELLVGIVTEIQERRLEVDKERDRLEKMASTNNKRGSISNPSHRRSLVGSNSTTTNSVVKFFQKHFHRKDKAAHNLL